MKWTIKINNNHMSIYTYFLPLMDSLLPFLFPFPSRSFLHHHSCGCKMRCYISSLSLLNTHLRLPFPSIPCQCCWYYTAHGTLSFGIFFFYKHTDVSEKESGKILIRGIYFVRWNWARENRTCAWGDVTNSLLLLNRMPGIIWWKFKL